jgi:hypothetical protein
VRDLVTDPFRGDAVETYGVDLQEKGKLDRRTIDAASQCLKDLFDTAGVRSGPAKPLKHALGFRAYGEDILGCSTQGVAEKVSQCPVTEQGLSPLDQVCIGL